MEWLMSEIIETNSGTDHQQKVYKKRKLSRVKWCLLGCLITIFVLVVCSVLIPSGLGDAVRWLGDNDFANQLRAIGKHEASLKDGLVEMVVDNVGISQITDQPVVILKQKGGDTYLPLLIGFTEVNAIAVLLEGVEVPRPLTPDLICSIMDKMGAKVDYIVINDLKDDIFYANIVLNANWMKLKIDSRPSDAIAIALRVKAPIYVTKAVLEEAGVSPGSEPEKYDTAYLKRDCGASLFKYPALPVAGSSPVD
jgi:bifunctional DNase/RNase